VARRGIGFIFQRHNLLESLTSVSKTSKWRWSFTAADAADHDQRIVAILDRLKLGDRIHYKTGETLGRASGSGWPSPVPLVKPPAADPGRRTDPPPWMPRPGRNRGDLPERVGRRRLHQPDRHRTTNRIPSTWRAGSVNMVDGCIKSNVVVTEAVVTLPVS